MSFNWSDYIKLSESLRCVAWCDHFNECCNDMVSKIYDKQEASFRTIINRNYYASFKRIQDYCNKKYKRNIPKCDSKGKEYGSHEKIIKFIEKYSSSLSDYLNILKKSRTDADYDSSIKINYNDVAYSFQLMNNIFQEFDKIQRLQKI